MTQPAQATNQEEQLRKELHQVEQSLVEVQSQIDCLLDKQSALQEQKSALKRQIKLTAENKRSSKDWGSESFSWSSDVKQKLNQLFKIEHFRPLQLETINSTLGGIDCLLIMPTGAGKSLCYQLPSTILQGVTLVISPLISLMEDQVMAMERLGIPAAMLNADTDKEVVKSIMADITTTPCHLRLLYVTPEKLAKSKRFMNKLEQSYKKELLSGIAIDEVHCCSQWGHDFRPDYKFLGVLKRQFPKTPILGVTATASSQVLNDVQKILQITHAQVFRGSFNRPNLYYKVEQKPNNHEDCVNMIAELINTSYASQSGIVYCFSRKDAATMADDLNKRGINAACYHAEMPAKSRSRVHSMWTENKVQVIVATIAFGMGIDKPDVRFVIHHSMSKSLENYYQESGRAGRDDQPADCVLFYKLGDLFRQSCMVFTESTGLSKLYEMLEYCLSRSTCRRQILARHFNESLDDQACQSKCDVCDRTVSDAAPLSALEGLANQASLVYEVLDKAKYKDARLTGQKVVDAITGKGATEHRSATKSAHSREQCEHLIASMLLGGCIREDFHFTPYSTISYIVVGSRSTMIPGLDALAHPQSDAKSNRPSTKASADMKKVRAKKRKVEDEVIVLE